MEKLDPNDKVELWNTRKNTFPKNSPIETGQKKVPPKQD